MNRLIIWLTMLLFAKKQLIGSCVIIEINDPSNEVKVRFMKKSGQYFLLSKKLERWFPKSAIFHRCSMPYHPLTIASVIPLIPSILKLYMIK